MSEFEKNYIKDLQISPGWCIIREYIILQVDNAKSRLITVDPEDKAKIYEYQGVIKNYNGLLTHIDKLTK